MISRFLQWFTAWFTFNVYFGDGENAFLSRHYTLGGEKTHWALFLHRFYRPDKDRELHDHPWTFVTFLFHRGYFEETLQGVKWRRRFSILIRPAEFLHRVSDVQPGTWTLVLRFSKVQSWGFLTKPLLLPTDSLINEHGWMRYKEFLTRDAQNRLKPPINELAKLFAPTCRLEHSNFVPVTELFKVTHIHVKFERDEKVW